MWAIDNDHAELAGLLLANGADVTVRAAANDWGSQISSEPRAQYRPTGGLTPLLFAARSGCTECAGAVLDAGADIDRPTPDGVTPLMLAIDNLNFDTAALLLDHGANPHYADWWGRTALYLAVDMNTAIAGGPRAGTTSMDIVERLLAAGVDVNPQLNFHRPGRGGNTARFTDDLLTTGATPLLRAAITHDHAAMRLLLDHGALVDLPNVMGVTPLMAAASVGVRDSTFGTNRSPSFDTDPRIEDQVIESLTILLEAGADINARITDLTSRSARIARPNQLDTDTQGLNDRMGQTALFRVAGRGRQAENETGEVGNRGWTRVVAFMLEHGADPGIEDALGRRAVDAAMGRFEAGHPVYEDVAALLE
jgi:ankyrin repeat protein